MHKRVILFFLSSILFLNVFFLVTFFLIAFFYQEITFNNFILIGLTLIIILSAAIVMRKYGRKEIFELSSKDAILSVASTWILVILVGTIPFLTFEVNFVNALFEATSGFTSTGSTIFSRPEDLPRSLLLWRSIMQWVGGMGIIVFFLTIIPNLGSSGKILFRSEVPGPIKENLTPHLQDTAKQLWLVYVFLTILNILAYRFSGLSWFDSINHAFTTISTGGFSTYGNSMAVFESHVQWIAIIFMVLGAINFSIFLLLFTVNRSQILKNSELKFFFIIIFLFSFIFFFLYLYSRLPPLADDSNILLNKLRISIFTVVSLLTTAGFTVVDITSFSHLLLGILLIIFFIGGCGGSTSGGIKIYRILLIFRALAFQVRKSLDPYLISSIKISKHRVEKGIVINVFIFVLVYITFFSVGTVLLFMDNNDFFLAFSTSSSMIGNVGPILVSVEQNFSNAPTYADLGTLSEFSKITCSILMIFGRLEIFTLLAIFHPLFWKRY